MTYKELIKDLDACIEGAKYGPYEWGFVALRAVVEFHKPICDDPNCCINQGGCECGEDFYPCRTIQTIEEKLQ